MTGVEGETAIIIAGVDSLVVLGLLAAGRVQVSRPARAARRAAASVVVPSREPAAKPAEESPRPVSGVITGQPRSSANPGLARYAARRPRNAETGQFLPLDRAS